ncbi:MAG: bifunctional DNA-formamidopyrimidine glycosylase/DNA-(apurinic or apyrimidinic site) lyase [Fimbriiglobus sp.]|nr:bifunctional DNA-formamidopyrimidine glycosylase/DNA-(apurinic or apyrimidinic site) lyase [Fimbriiglobus sp.]
MPELPEVETVARDLRPLLAGRKVVAFWVGEAKLRRPWKRSWSGLMAGLRFGEVRRRGKWLMLPLESRKPTAVAGTLLVHLGMTGQFTVVPADDPWADHTHFVFFLDNQTHLRFRDIRRFGSVEWFPAGQDVDNHLGEKLGPEPLDIPAAPFAEAMRRSKRTLKAILLDQAVVAGVGNIYADEALFRAGLHPKRRGHTLTAAECDRLRTAIETVIARAIESRGSTIRDYVGGSGLRGGFQNEFAVYGRTGEKCVTCAGGIERVVVSGRSSHFCPVCQPAGG